MLKRILAISDSDPTFFPQSGPGSKYLLTGTRQAGFFGEVSAAELFDGYEVNNKINHTGATWLRYSGLKWLKHIVDGKVLFVAKEQTLRNISWSQLYESGAVYGVAGDGKYPTAKPTSQMVVLRKTDTDGAWTFKLRLIKGAALDPYVAANETAAVTEWIHTIFNVAARLPGYSYLNFSYGGAVIDTLAQETDNANVASSLTVGSVNNIGAKTVAAKTALGYWRPVLELIRPSESLMPIEDVTAVKDDLIQPLISIEQTDSISLVRQLENFSSAVPTEPYMGEPVILVGPVYKVNSFTIIRPSAPYVSEPVVTAEPVHKVNDFTIIRPTEPYVSSEIIPW